MRTIEEVVEDFRHLTLHPMLIDKLLNEILEIHKTEKTKTGHWVQWTDDKADYCKCSECGYGEEGEVKYGEETPYCPICGAEMSESKYYAEIAKSFVKGLKAGLEAESEDT